MLKKRIIGVVTVLGNQAVQSVGYKKYLPLGSPEYQIENLDNWNVDEIIINCIDRTKKRLGPHFDLLKKISKKGISTPICYSGAIRSLEDARDVILLGAERICIDNLLNEDIKTVQKISEKIGRQAMIGVSPISLKKNVLYRYDYLSKKSINFNMWCKSNYVSDLISEMLIVDYKNEGKKNKFNLKFLSHLNKINENFILFGGISSIKIIEKLFENKKVAGICIGNFLSHFEHANKYYTDFITSNYHRRPKFLKKKYFN